MVALNNQVAISHTVAVTGLVCLQPMHYWVREQEQRGYTTHAPPVRPKQLHSFLA